MNNLFKKLFFHSLIQSLVLYTGFVALVVIWPIANMVLKNDSFRIIGGWSFMAYLFFLLFYGVFPVFLLAATEYFLKKINETYSLFFRYSLFIIGSILIFGQMAEYHLTAIIKSWGLITTPFRNYGLYIGLFLIDLFFIFLVYKLRKSLSLFLKFLSPLMLIALGLLFFSTFQAEKLYSPEAGNENLSPSAPSFNKNIYLLILDGVSLTRLMEKEQINKKLFPTFYLLSQEWTWYRNATTNATSTIPARSMIFSGRYYGDKLSSLKGFNDVFLQRVSPVLNLQLFSDVDIKVVKKTNIIHAIWLNKALFPAYLSISIPPPARGYIYTIFRNWAFDWRGETPEEYQGKEDFYYGRRIKEQFFNFLNSLDNISNDKGNFFLLWSTITHFPYIFDEQGDIIENQQYHTFKIGMSQEDIEKVDQNYLKTLKYIDSLISVFIKQLKENGLYDNAVILITSDHGMNKKGSNYDINEDVFRIPFFLKAPGILTGVDDRDVQLVDITPTISDILGLPFSSEYDGQSLFLPYQPRDKIIYALGVPGFWKLKDDKAVWHSW